MLTKYRNQDLGLLLIRLGLAYIFIEHSLQKLSNIAGSLKFFGHLGLPAPLFTLYFVCIIELIGGVCMLLGAFTDIAGLLLAVDMLGVIITVRTGPMAKGLLAGHEFELMLLIMSLAITLIGPGMFSLMRPKRQQMLV
jgi:putative oxidoreductase